MSKPDDVCVAVPTAGRWFAKPRTARWEVDRMPGAFWVFHLAFLGGLGSDALHWTVLTGLCGLALVLYLLGCLATLFFRYRARQHSLSERAILDRENADHYAAEVTIVVGHKPIGADRGVIWFADGVMGFSGACTSFVLAAKDLQADWVGRRKAKWDRTFGKLEVRLKGVTPGAVIEFNPLSPRESWFEFRFDKFYRAQEEPQEARQWPPLQPYVPESHPLEQAVRP